MTTHVPRLATVDDANDVARLLHAFNTEFATPTPAPEVLTARLTSLLAGDTTFAVIAGSPPNALALCTVRPNVWFDGPVVVLDELYVGPELRNQGIGTTIIEFVISECRSRGVELIEINVDEPDTDAQRFYERHGWTSIEESTGERAFYYYRELAN